MDTACVGRFLVFFFVLINGIASAQYIDDPKPLFYIDEIGKSGKPEDHLTFLSRDVPSENDCITTWGIFYFRVTGKNLVDSLHHTGTLNNGMRDQIVKNIYSTQGHWKFPPGTKSTRKYWFVYSHFSFGPYVYTNPRCDKFQGTLQKNIMELAENIIVMSRYSGNRERFILQPRLVGSEYSIE